MNSRNNPLNIKGSDSWKGKTGQDERGHMIFSSPAYGFRAGMRTLQSKWLNGKRTLIAIISEWAPPSDTIGSIKGNAPNDPDAYTHFICARNPGITPNQPLPDPKTDPFIWAKIIKAMARYECGQECLWSDVFEGMALWMRDFSEGK